jgi:hypothetical protein
MLFDVTSVVRQKRTKHDPHYSQFSGTYSLFYHDLLHHKEQSAMEANLISEYDIDWWQILVQLNELRLTIKETDPNDYKILTNALFILSHELINVTPYKYNTFIRYQGHLPEDATFTDVIRLIQQSMIKSTSQPRTLFYKINFRDHEFILKGVTDELGTPFIPENFVKLSLENKQKAIGIGYQRFWDYFLTLISKLDNE